MSVLTVEMLSRICQHCPCIGWATYPMCWWGWLLMLANIDWLYAQLGPSRASVYGCVRCKCLHISFHRAWGAWHMHVAACLISQLRLVVLSYFQKAHLEVTPLSCGTCTTVAHPGVVQGSVIKCLATKSTYLIGQALGSVGKGLHWLCWSLTKPWRLLNNMPIPLC